MLRPALQLALDVARVGIAASPAVEAPRALRPFLHFTGRLPDAALAAVRRAVEDDEVFRARIAGLAEEGELGRAGWLFVVRPEGWEIELASLSQEAEARARADREEREERSARRRLTHAEEATQRAEAVAARARADLALANSELTAERGHRRAAQEDAAQLARRVTSLEGERGSARRRAVASSAEAERLRAEVQELRADLAHAQAAIAALGAEAGSATAASPTPGADAARPAGSDDVFPDAPAVARAVEAAAAAAAALSRALAEASAALTVGPPPAADVGRGSVAAPGSPSPPARSQGSAPVRRRPSGLPPAVFDDTAEAAAHLVRVPNALVLVDGYNAAKALWPDVAPHELRERLVDALSELVARTGVSVHVVYDGADLGLLQTRPVSRRGVRVSFSPAGVEADDVILDLVEVVPLDRPVVVASSDRRVQDGARQRGANVISSAQLAAVLGRS